MGYFMLYTVTLVMALCIVMLENTERVITSLGLSYRQQRVVFWYY